jgi:hypothetical protein
MVGGGGQQLLSLLVGGHATGGNQPVDHCFKGRRGRHRVSLAVLGGRVRWPSE